MEKYKNTYRIQSNRLRGYDYGAHGLYFVTICTKDRVHYFGEIDVDMHHCASQKSAPPSVETHHCASLKTTEIGRIAIDFWNAIPHHYSFVELDEYVLMPNHFHGILFFNRPDRTNWKHNEFGPQSENLGSVIRAFKSSVKRYANKNNLEFHWQPRYHDRIISNEKELLSIRQYIIDNPMNWINDSLYEVNCKD